jgi:lipoprotein NlpI
VQEIGDLERNTDNIADARKAYEETLDIRRGLIARDPTNPELQGDLAASLRRVGSMLLLANKYDEALADYDASIKLKPDYSPAYFDRAQVEIYLGRLSAALDDLGRAVQLSPQAAYSVIWLHIVRGKAGINDQEEFPGNASKIDHSAWPWPVVELYLGSSNPAELSRPMLK